MKVDSLPVHPFKEIADSWPEEVSSTQFYGVSSFCTEKLLPEMKPFKFTGSLIILLVTDRGDMPA